MEINRLFDIPIYQKKVGGLKAAIGGKHVEGHNYSYSTNEFVNYANKVSRGLLKLGLKPGDKVALISYNNRPEWNIMDIGMAQLGVINVPVYPTISPRDYIYIFNDSSVKYCFVGHGDLVDKVREAQKELPLLEGIFTFDQADATGEDANGMPIRFWEDIFTDDGQDEAKQISDSINREDLATIIYTSGTTGDPKGVMLSHGNILSNLEAVLPLVPIARGDTALSFLPLCHIFERVVTYAYMCSGVSIFYAQSVDTLGESLLEVRPHFFTTVPRLLEKVYEKIITKVKQESTVKQKIFFWAESLTNSYQFGQKLNGIDNLKWLAAEKIVFGKLRDRLGGRVKGILTGAAACPKKMAQFFSAIGIPVREGYGMTETSPAIAVSGYEDNMALLGTVGPIISNAEVKIDIDEEAYGPMAGEILVKGPNVMMGYYNKPDKTAEVIDKDGWLHTGDVGRFIRKGKVDFLKITDRKKELFKTSGGKYVAPAFIEGKFRESFLIEQFMVVGDGRKYVTGIILPAVDALKDWAGQQGISVQQYDELLKNPKVVSMYDSIVKKTNTFFGKTEKIKKVMIVPGPWDVDSGELTPTMKLKRRVVLAKYSEQIEQLYKD